MHYPLRKLLAELAYFATKENSKRLFAIAAKVVKELNPPRPQEDMFYEVNLRALEMAFRELTFTYSRNEPQRKRLMKLWDEIEEVIRND